MLSESQMIAAIVSGALLLGLFAIIYGPWQWFWADWYRQQLFETRDKIFDMAVSGRISFSDPNYKEIRRGIEAQIRYAHRATLPMVFLLAAGFLAVGRRRRQTKLSHALSGIGDIHTRRDIEALLSQNSFSLLVMLLVRSPLSWIPIGLSLLFLYMVGHVKHLCVKVGRAVFTDVQVGAEGAIGLRQRPATSH